MVTAAPRLFDLALAPVTLEGGARLEAHVARGWWWGPPGDPLEGVIAALPPAQHGGVVRRGPDELRGLTRPGRARPGAGVNEVPTALVIHALTGDARAGGEGGWWGPLIGPGRALDPTTMRVLSFNLLGSCYGSSGPGDAGFPAASDDRGPAPAPPPKGAFTLPEGRMPATVTTWDQARALLLALDALGVGRLALVTGGSLGGMVALALGALAPGRVERLATLAAMDAASSWVVALNHVGRQAVVADGGLQGPAERGLALARQLATISYRSEASLDRVQGARTQAGVEGGWSPRAPYRVQTYLEHQGERLVQRFDARSYLALLGAMDHHDLARRPPPPGPGESWRDGPADAALGWGVGRLTASTLAVGIDSDLLYLPHHSASLVERLRRRGVEAHEATLTSPHGHDAFLLEWPQLGRLLQRALALPPPR